MTLSELHEIVNSYKGGRLIFETDDGVRVVCENAAIMTMRNTDHRGNGWHGPSPWDDVCYPHIELMVVCDQLKTTINPPSA